MYQDILKELKHKMDFLLTEIEEEEDEVEKIAIAIKVIKDLACPVCQGTGEERVYGPSGSLEYDTCPACGGKGYKVDKQE